MKETEQHCWTRERNRVAARAKAERVLTDALSLYLCMCESKRGFCRHDRGTRAHGHLARLHALHQLCKWEPGQPKADLNWLMQKYTNIITHFYNNEDDDDAIQTCDVVVACVVAPHVEHALYEHCAAVDQLCTVFKLQIVTPGAITVLER